MPNQQKNYILCALFTSLTITTALDNLEEAEFDKKKISVIANDQSSAQHIADPAGPFKGKSVDDIQKALEKAALPISTINLYHDQMAKGMIFLAISVKELSIKTAQEILADSGGLALINI